MTMIKAISLHQPWASAIAIGAKSIETRDWETGHRGPLAIHAARRLVKSDLAQLAKLDCWQAALAPLGDGAPLTAAALAELLPLGAVVAVAELVDCVPFEALRDAEYTTRKSWPAGALPLPPAVAEAEAGASGLDLGGAPRTARAPEPAESPGWTENDLGNFGPGRVAWILSAVRPLRTPVPFTGQQGLFEIDDALWR